MRNKCSWGRLKNYALKTAETLLKKIKGHQANENIHMMNGLSLVLVRQQYPKQLMQSVQCAFNAMCMKFSVHQMQCAPNAVCIKSSVHQKQCVSNAVCIKCNVHQTQCASNAVYIKALPVPHKRPYLRFIQIGKPKSRNLNQ